MFYKTILLVLMLMTFGASIKPHQPYGDDPCTECEQVVGTIHMLLANNETETSVLAAMQQVCGMLPSVYQQLCSEAVSTYGKELIDAAVKYLADPSQLCSLLGLCNGTLSQVEAFENLRSISTVYTSSRYGVDEILPDNLKGISNCGLCEFVTSIIQGIFEDQPIQDFVHDELSKFCHLLPQSESVVCLEAIRELEPEMYMAFVKKYLNPTTFCPSIGICPPN